jgi:TolA-binding protein
MRTSLAGRVCLSLVCSILLIGQTACLQTRSNVKEQEEKQVLRKQVVTLQQTTADTSSRFSEIEEDLRKTSGRFETLDSRITQIKERAEKNDFSLESKIKEQETKFQVLREELAKQQAEIAEIRAANQVLQAALAAGGATGKTSSGSEGKNPFEVGELKFEQKNWKDAIFAFEEYRKSNPKGKNAAAATYKIGVSFQELGLNEDAKPFYEEVVAKFPKSKEADRARARLKALNKKR